MCCALNCRAEDNSAFTNKIICMGEFTVTINPHGNVTYELIEPVWTDDDVNMLAQLVYNEARGVKSKMEQAAVIWCVLNRVDYPNAYGNTIKEVVTAPNQFAYRTNTPIKSEFRVLAYDVLHRWWSESQGEEHSGRVLPADYIYFSANRSGTRNVFRNNYNFNKCKFWDWSLDNPYEN